MATPKTSDETDRAEMAAALALARRGLGLTGSNPAVGCLLTRGFCVVGRGWTGPGGRPHAETIALEQAGEAARGATCYVTLEPCNHFGQTPPCAEALIKAGIKRCVVAISDPDPRVSGRGIERLREAGVEVTLGVLAEKAARINAGFLLHRSEGRPFVTLKLATSLDGRIATRNGESKWITGEQARARAHLLRAQHDAVAVGSGTAVADDPALTVRLDGLVGRQPLRVVFDGRLRLPLTRGLVATAAEHPTLLVTRKESEPQRLEAYRQAGVELLLVHPDEDGNLDLGQALAGLAEEGVTRLLVEGGGGLAAGLLRLDLVDALVWFRAGVVLGGDGRPGVAGLGLERLVAAPRFVLSQRRDLGPDVMEFFRRAR